MLFVDGAYYTPLYNIDQTAFAVVLLYCVARGVLLQHFNQCTNNAPL
ncbi:hypothetical protein VPHD528_0020 [Vibrio phage D528]